MSWQRRLGVPTMTVRVVLIAMVAASLNTCGVSCADQPDLAEAKAEKAVVELESQEMSQKMSQKADMAATMKKLERARAAARSFKAKGINNAAGGPTILLQTGAGFDPGNAVASGDTIYLKTHTGKHIDVEGTTVQARWNSQDSWQALTIEKAGGGSVQSGDTIYLKTHTGKHIDVEGTAVQARWNDQGSWQALTIEKTESCWVRLPSGCNNALSETSTPTEWFIDPSNGAGATSCAASRLAAFNSYCGRSDAENHWGTAPPGDPPHFNTVQSDPASPISDATSVCRAWYISDGPVKHGSNQAAADALKSAGTWEKGTKHTCKDGNCDQYQWQQTDGTGWAMGYKRGCTEVTAGWGVFTACGCYEIWCPIRWETLSHPDDIYGRDASGEDGSMAVRTTCYSARAVFGCYKNGEWKDNCGTQKEGSYQPGAGTSAGQWNRYWEQLVF